MELINTFLFADANLQAYYRFNTGALTTDSKASFTLTNTNTVGEINPAKYGVGADFGASNTNKRLEISSAVGLTNTGNRTYAGFFKRADSAAVGSLVSHTINSGGANGVNFDLRVASDTTLFIERTTNTLNDNATLTVTAMGVLWHHFAVTFDGSNMRTYLDAVLVGTTAYTNTATDSSTQKFSISMRSDVGDQFYSGYKDDYAVFNKTLILSEVKAHALDNGGAFLLHMM